MRRFMKPESKRITAALLGLLILAAALFSVAFLIAEADHDCAGENCSVCVCIRICTEFLTRQRQKAFVVAETVLPVLCVLLPALVFSAPVTKETPVSGKVRLNN